MNLATITLPPKLKLNIDLTDEQFFELCQNNRDLRFERTAKGELIVISPPSSDTGSCNFDVAVEVGIWNKQTKLGKGFDSCSGFKLPNGAERSPEVSWIKQERWDALTPEEQKKFAPICPAFVVEISSDSDNLKDLQEKTQ